MRSYGIPINQSKCCLQRSRIHSFTKVMLRNLPQCFTRARLLYLLCKEGDMSRDAFLMKPLRLDESRCSHPESTWFMAKTWKFVTVDWNISEIDWNSTVQGKILKKLEKKTWVPFRSKEKAAYLEPLRSHWLVWYYILLIIIYNHDPIYDYMIF